MRLRPLGVISGRKVVGSRNPIRVADWGSMSRRPAREAERALTMERILSVLPAGSFCYLLSPSSAKGDEDNLG